MQSNFKKMEKVAAYCGIDVSLKSHKVCLLDGKQEVIRRFSILNNRDGFETLENSMDKNTLICLEPTGVYSINIFIYIKKRGYNIRFCGTCSSRRFRESMFGKKKHDNLDCLALAKYRLVNEDLTFDGLKLLEKFSELNNYKKDKKYLLFLDKVEEYKKISKKISILKTKIKAIIDIRFPEAIEIFNNRGCKAIMEALCHSKEDILKGKVECKKLSEIQEKIKNSIGQYDVKANEFKDYVDELKTLEEQVKNLQKTIKTNLYEMGYSSLFDYKGLDTINIALLVNEIADIKRFFKYSQNGQFNKKRSLRAFKEFMGIAVTSNQSGGREGGHKLVRSGNIELRNILFMMTLSYIGNYKDATTTGEYKEFDPVRFRNLYEKLVNNNVKKMVAITKVMNKIATDLFFVLKDVTETAS